MCIYNLVLDSLSGDRPGKEHLREIEIIFLRSLNEGRESETHVKVFDAGALRLQPSFPTSILHHDRSVHSYFGLVHLKFI